VTEQSTTDKQNAKATVTAAPQVEYSVSSGLANRLARSKFSVAFTSYQSGLLYFVGLNPNGGINIH